MDKKIEKRPKSTIFITCEVIITECMICLLFYNSLRDMVMQNQEIKMVYDVKNNSLSANYQYDLIIQASDTLVPQLVEEAWFEEIKQQMVNN